MNKEQYASALGSISYRMNVLTSQLTMLIEEMRSVLLADTQEEDQPTE